MKFTQPSLFAGSRRASVSFPTFYRRKPRKPVVVRGGSRKATAKFSGDSWFRKMGRM